MVAQDPNVESAAARFSNLNINEANGTTSHQLQECQEPRTDRHDVSFGIGPTLTNGTTNIMAHATLHIMNPRMGPVPPDRMKRAPRPQNRNAISRASKPIQRKVNKKNYAELFIRSVDDPELMAYLKKVQKFKQTKITEYITRMTFPYGHKRPDIFPPPTVAIPDDVITDPEPAKPVPQPILVDLEEELLLEDALEDVLSTPYDASKYQKTTPAGDIMAEDFVPRTPDPYREETEADRQLMAQVEECFYDFYGLD